MALDSLCYKMPCRNPASLLLGHNSRVAKAIPNVKRRASSSRINLCGRGAVSFYTMIQASPSQHGFYRAHCVNRHNENLELEDYHNPLRHSLGSSRTSEDHQTSLESVFDKANNETKQTDNHSSQLKSLDKYLGSLGEDTNMFSNIQSASSTNIDVSQDTIDKRIQRSGTKTFVGSRRKRNEKLPSASETLFMNDEGSDLYLVSALASIDIAVFLFEVASPIKNSEYNLYSLPLLYGAKVNDLILVGEWWRLVTPMFLHSGVVHVALSCWVLLDFGPRVCKVYGSFTFFFVCLLGGISGNLMSFLHTQEPTVGGSGPIFAIIGAWMIYQIQNKGVIPKEVADKMFQKATIATVLSFGLINFSLIDDWTYLGAVLTGITYGFLTCPVLQLDEPLSKATREEGIALVGQFANPCKSLVVFVIFVLVFSSLLYLTDSPLETPLLKDLLEIIE